MIPFEEALAKVLDLVSPLPAESVPSVGALGRFLARDLVAGSDSPRFDNTSVDGYAVRLEDVRGAREERPASG